MCEKGFDGRRRRRRRDEVQYLPCVYRCMIVSVGIIYKYT
jgi:hypothetical protein